jgi:hypothetical protein
LEVAAIDAIRLVRRETTVDVVIRESISFWMDDDRSATGQINRSQKKEYEARLSSSPYPPASYRAEMSKADVRSEISSARAESMLRWFSAIRDGHELPSDKETWDVAIHIAHLISNCGFYISELDQLIACVRKGEWEKTPTTLRQNRPSNWKGPHNDSEFHHPSFA